MASKSIGGGGSPDVYCTWLQDVRTLARQLESMDLVRTSPNSAGVSSPSLPRKPHHPTSHEGVDVPTQNGISQPTFIGDLAFPCPAKTGDESSPTAGTKLDEGGRKMTYAELIRIAFLSRTTKQMGLRELYSWFEQNTRRANRVHKGWKNSVRSNLCLNQAFQRVDGKGSLWELADAGLTEFQPTRKPRENCRKKTKVSTTRKSRVAPPSTPCASNSRNVLPESMSETGQDYGSPRFIDGRISPERSQPEGEPSTGYPMPSPIASTEDGLEPAYDALWAWNLDSRRYVNWPYCNCFCNRHQLGRACVGDMMPVRATPAYVPMLVNVRMGSSPLPEALV